MSRPARLKPEGPLSITMASLKAAIAHTAAWQCWCGVADTDNPADEAESHLHLMRLSNPEDATANGGTFDDNTLSVLRPFGCIRPFVPPGEFGGGPYSAKQLSPVAGSFVAGLSRLELHIEDLARTEEYHDDADIELYFVNQIGLLATAIAGMESRTDHLTAEEIADGFGGIGVRQVELYQPIERCTDEQADADGDFIRASLLITL